ncbi:hypothetical protein [Deinococcus sp.]
MSRGGSSGPDNIAWTCERCNFNKASKLLNEWKFRWYLPQ